MRKYKFRKQSVKEFLKKHGFKAALALSIVGLGIAAYSAIGSFDSMLNPHDTVSKPVENIVSGITGQRPTESAIDSSEAEDSSSQPPVSSKEPESPVSKPESDIPEPSQPENTPTVELSYPEYFYLPVNGRVNKDFSFSAPVFSATMGDWRAHNGTDFEAEQGARVIATAAGIVTDVKYEEAWGYIIDVDHGGGLSASYRNLNSDIQVEIGDVLKAGQVIGGVGEGGYEECVDPVHLHLEMTLDGKFVDPVTVMNKKTA